MSNYITAISRLSPNLGVDSTSDLYEDIDWHGQTPVSKQSLDAEIAAMASIGIQESPETVNVGGTEFVERNGTLVPISSVFVSFDSNTNSAKAFYLNSGSIASNVGGFIVPRDCTIVSISIGLESFDKDVKASIRLNRSQDTAITVIAKSLRQTFATSINVAAGTELGVYVESSNVIKRPRVQLELTWRLK
jgi:hypothetical protein